MAVRPTKVIDSIASLMPSAVKAAIAASLTLDRETPSRLTVEDTSIASLLRARIFGVRLDDLAHKPVPDDVSVAEIVESDSVDARKDPLDLYQP